MVSDRIFGGGIVALTRSGFFSMAIVNGSFRSNPALAVNVPTRRMDFVLPSHVWDQE